ncbi:MAG: choice-of-anchor J domain-containing protein [bacterium]|nr:choice-of-anchor J domain-containing protein [bacterium]
MKAKIAVIFLAQGMFLGIQSQVLLNEGFTSPFTPSLTGWVVQNNTIPLGTVSWIQGSSASFNSFNGAPADYYACNFNSQAATYGVISNFLMTPVLNIVNGAVLQFATRTTTAATWPDRLQVRLSAGNSSVIPTGTNSVGTFTNLLLDINPALTLLTSSVINNGTVNGYPDSWTVFTLTLSGISAPGPGRFAFRYFVEDGGPAGPNSDFIGLDAVKYTVYCGAMANNYTVCANSSTTLNATGGISPLSYTWSPGGSNTSSIVVSPSASVVYTLNYTEATVSCPAKTFTVTVGSQLSTSITANTSSVCAGTAVTLSVTTPASSYTWSNGSNSAVTSVTPTPPFSTYSISALSGACTGSSSILIYVSPIPSPVISLSPTILCPNSTVSAIASGISTFSWTLNNLPMTTQASSMILTQTNNDANKTITLTVSGTNTSGCFASVSTTAYVQPITTISVAASNSAVCPGNEFTLTASGAATYTWSGLGSGTVNPAVFTASSSPGNMFFNIYGTSSLGCSGFSNKAMVVADCLGIEKLSSSEGGISASPNPFSSELRIQGFEGRIELYNSLGQLIICQTISSDHLLSTEELVKGSYLLSFKNNNGKTTKVMKLLKN